jgi:C4-type Zn-finger protein
MQHKEKMISSGYGCPFCGDDCNQEPIEDAKNGHFENQYFEAYECHNCNKRWREVYDLTDAEEIEEIEESEAI